MPTQKPLYTAQAAGEILPTPIGHRRVRQLAVEAGCPGMSVADLAQLAGMVLQGESPPDRYFTAEDVAKIRRKRGKGRDRSGKAGRRRQQQQPQDRLMQ